jgi:hypothetical protein
MGLEDQAVTQAKETEKPNTKITKKTEQISDKKMKGSLTQRTPILGAQQASTKANLDTQKNRTDSKDRTNLQEIQKGLRTIT